MMINDNKMDSKVKNFVSCRLFLFGIFCFIMLIIDTILQFYFLFCWVQYIMILV